MILVSSILNYLRLERDRRATRTLLHAMDDHLLRDIGLRRDQIDTLVAEQREFNRQRAAADAESTRKTQTPDATFGDHGIAAQH